MKKTLFLAVLAGAALAGCVKNEPIPAMGDGSPEGITFAAPVVTTPTRATEIVRDFPTGESFAVYAYRTDTKIENTVDIPSIPGGNMYMENVTCTHKGTGAGEEPNDYWAPARNYYWPKNGCLHFGAYYPVMLNPNEGTKNVEWSVNEGFKFNNYVVGGVADQVDLLYSDPAYNQTKENQANNLTPYDGIELTFKHALSSIIFQAKSEGALGGDKIYITNITVKDVYDKGNFTQNLYDTSTTNEVAAAWDVDESKDLVSYVVYNDANGIELNGDEKPINGVLDENDADGKRRSDLILMPQTLNGGAEGRGEGVSPATVSITYKIVYADETPDNNEDNETSEETVNFNLGVVADGTQSSIDYKWEMGKRYIYHISIGLQKIYFNPQVTDWDDAKDGIVIDPTTGQVVETPAEGGETPANPETPEQQAA